MKRGPLELPGRTFRQFSSEREGEDDGCDRNSSKPEVIEEAAGDIVGLEKSGGSTSPAREAKTMVDDSEEMISSSTGQERAS